MKVLRRSDLDRLMHKLNYLNRTDRAVVKKAYLLSEDAHKFQKRLSGEPYFIHPLNVATILAEYKLDHETICAALLHDVLEDTTIGEDIILKEFGENIFNLVKSVTKISYIKKNRSKKKQAADNIRRLILATVRDPRVILVKLADKLHNMRTLEYQSGPKAQLIAQEVLDIYAPLASRLGIYKVKWELEDLGFYHLDPEGYSKLKKSIAEKKSDREVKIKAVTKILSDKLKEARLKTRVEGRSKHFYSIYQKMELKEKTFDEIYDLTGLRVFVESDRDCYTALGVIHTLWNPVPGRFKDYVAVPKSNGYQSLHTTVSGIGGHFMEVQIRTMQMHLISEFGIAAHWSYKTKNAVRREVELLQNVAAMEELGKSSLGFIRELKENLTEDEVYVFTPKGEVITLKTGATVLDLAFRIHTELGLKCAGAKIGSRLVSIRTELKSGYQVEIITNKRITPSEHWLQILQTTQARSKLRAWLRKEEAEHKGEVISETSSALIMEVQIRAIDEPKLWFEIIRILTLSGIHLLEGTLSTQKGETLFYYKLEVDSPEIWRHIRDSIQRLHGIKQMRTMTGEDADVGK